MDIIEFEKAIGLPRTVIFYYDSHLLADIPNSPKGPRYCSYNENDTARIKTIVLLRKLGISVEDIGALQAGKTTLHDLLQKRAVYYAGELASPDGAKRFCTALLAAGETIDTLNIDIYSAAVQKAEAAGEAFEDISKDRMGRSSLTRTYWNLLLSQHFGKTEKHDLACSIPEALTIAVGCELANQFLVKGGSFGQTFLQILGLFCAFSLIALPINLLGRKHPTAALRVLNGLAITGVLLLCLLILFIAVLLLNHALHFWY